MSAPVPFILDTDIGTDVDDALALALALRHPALDLRAVTTVSGDVVARAAIARRLLAIAGRPDIEVAAGVGGFADRAWFGHEGVGLAAAKGRTEPPLSSRRAVALLLAPEYRGVAVATVGMQSNVAAAVVADPTWPAQVPLLAVMGGIFGPLFWEGMPQHPRRDHNLNVDPGGSVAALNAGIATLYVPCDVTFGTSLTTRHLEHLRAHDDFGRALAELVDVWTPIMRRNSRGRLTPGRVAVMHDPLTVACLVERSFVTVERLPVTVGVHDGAVRTFVDPVAGHEADVVRSVDAEAFADWWLDVVTAA